MKKLILPSELEGCVAAPASKSQTIRALAAALLAKGESRLVNPSFCDDALSCLRLIEQLGAEVETHSRSLNRSWQIKGGFPDKKGTPLPGMVLSCGESALTMRLFAAVVGLQSHPITLEAKGSLRRRPMDMVEEPLRQLNVICRSQGGFPPLLIQGPIKPGSVRLDGSRSSQALTGMLMVLPLLAKDSEILALNLKSRPYVELTLGLIQFFGISVGVVSETENWRFIIRGRQSYQPTFLEVEGDWSGASFFVVAAALTGRVELTGLNPNSRQADKQILVALKAAGGKFYWEGSRLIVDRASLRGFEFDASDCPDLFPPLCVLAIGAEGRSRIKGAHRLTIKESNRAAALVEELSRVGARITQEEDSLILEGRRIGGGVMDSRGDHRLAMAGAIAGLISREGIVVSGSKAVNKSFPDFFEKLKNCGGKVQ